MGGNGRVLQVNAKWEGSRGSTNVHKCAAKASVGMLQGNSLELTYKLRFQKNSWLEDYITLPRHIEVSTTWSRFPKIVGTITQEFTSLAMHPTLGFGMEHDLTLGCWTWVWEGTYGSSTFRIPIPVIHLGTISNPGAFYSQKFYYGIYCLLLQSMMADLLQDEEDKKPEISSPKETSKIAEGLSIEKTRKDAERQLAMMQPIAEKKRHLESQKDGFVVLRATYWVETSSDVSHPDGNGLHSMDVTTQLQFWVSDGRLYLPPIPKSSWLGFRDLRSQTQTASHSFKWDWRIWRRLTHRAVHPERAPEPQLTIRYSYASYVYEITVGEKVSLTLPNKKAQLLGHASSVH